MTLDEATRRAGAVKGLQLSELPPGTVIEVRTQNRTYRIVSCGGRKALISGHPKLCPRPTQAKVHGSTWGGSMLKTDFIGCGMCLEYSFPGRRTVTTSPIVAIRLVGRDQTDTGGDLLEAA